MRWAMDGVSFRHEGIKTIAAARFILLAGERRYRYPQKNGPLWLLWSL